MSWVSFSLRQLNCRNRPHSSGAHGQTAATVHKTVKPTNVIATSVHSTTKWKCCSSRCPEPPRRESRSLPGQQQHKDMDRQPMLVAPIPRIAASSMIIFKTPRCCMPIARSVPISRVRSLTAIHKALMIPRTMIPDRTHISKTNTIDGLEHPLHKGHFVAHTVDLAFAQTNLVR